MPAHPDQLIARACDPGFMLGDPDALRQSLQVITPKSAVVSTHLAPRGHGQSPKVLRRQVLSGILDRKDNCHERLSLPPTGRTA